MASQKLTNCCVAAIALVTATYLGTPHSSTIARLAFGVFCLAIGSFAFLRKHLIDEHPDMAGQLDSAASADHADIGTVADIQPGGNSR
jgi:hypothetical protein